MEKGYLIRYDGNHSHVYKIWISRTGKVHHLRDVTFNENGERYHPPSTANEPQPTPLDEP